MPNPTSLTVEQRHLDAAAQHCGFVNWADLLAWGPRQSHVELAEAFARFEADHLTSTDRLRDALEPFASMATEMERVAAQHGIHPSKVGRSHSYEHCVAAREALTSTPAPSGEREAEDSAAPTANIGDLTPRVKRLITAARVVAFDEDFGDTAIRELDQATEAFAADIAWKDEPDGPTTRGEA